MNKNTFIEQLRSLVEIRTVSGDVEANNEALNVVEKWFDKKLSVKRFTNGKAEVLVASTKEGMSPAVCYLTHMDVVAGKDEQFKMKFDGDKLVGRGTSDMKFSIPIGVAILNDAAKKGMDMCLVITTDEETGGLEGAKFLREKLNFSPKLLIVPDGGENLNFVDRAKGVCQLRIAAKGKPAHASRPWLGKNALASIVKLAGRLLAEYEKNNLTEGWVTTMNIGIIDGGISTNQVCAEAEMKLDFRYPENDSIESIKDRVEKLAQETDKDLEVSYMSTGLPTFTDVNDERVVRYIKVMKKIYGKKIETKPTYGASDARHFADLNVPILMHKPLGGGIHSDDEWVSLASVIIFEEGLRKYLGLTG